MCRVKPVARSSELFFNNVTQVRQIVQTFAKDVKDAHTIYSNLRLATNAPSRQTVLALLPHVCILKFMTASEG